MANALNELAKLDFGGVKWITTLRNKICESGKLEESDIEKAFNDILCDKTNINVPLLPKESNDNSKAMSLYRLYNNKNVSGLADGKEIIFSPFFTLLYGMNGTGKSTIYKVLKDAFHSNQDIKPNIYKSPIKSVVSAKIELVKSLGFKQFQQTGDNKSFLNSLEFFEWKPNNTENRKIKFCDNQILIEALTKKDTGWSVDRYKLNSYTYLRNAVDDMETKTQNKLNEIEENITKKYDTIVAILNSSDDDSIKSSIISNKENYENLLKLFQELKAQKLPKDHEKQKTKLARKINRNISDYTTEIDNLESRVKLIERIKTHLVVRKKIFNNWEFIKKTIHKIIELKSARDFSYLEKNELLFSLSSDPEKLDLYIKLIKKIADIALVFGFENYPQDIQKCFYCNQALPESNKKLIEEIHRLVDDQVQVEIDNLTSSLSKIVDEIENNLTYDRKEISSFEIKEIQGISDVEKKSPVVIGEYLLSVMKNEPLHKIKNDIEKLDIAKDIDGNLKNLSSLCIQILDSEKNCTEWKIKDKRDELDNIEESKKKAESNLEIIIDLENVIKSHSVINELILELKDWLAYKAASLKFRSFKKKISSDLGRVEKILLRKNYEKTFNSHLSDFGLQKKEKIKRKFSNPESGSKIETEITSNGSIFEIGSILSEGEAKVCALCDWFTELQFDDIHTVIFDDPVTSLDQGNIELLAKKIAELSNEYQVVVFTHNMEFYNYLIHFTLGGKAIDKKGCEICANFKDNYKCHGFKENKKMLFKCGNYYEIKYYLEPGYIEEGIIFSSMNYLNKLSSIKSAIECGDDSKLDKNLRFVINDFVEKYVFADIKRAVFKGEDLIHFKKNMREIDQSNYNKLVDLHHRISSRSGELHSTDSAIRTKLSPKDYATIYNDVVEVINKVTNNKIPNIEI